MIAFQRYSWEYDIDSRHYRPVGSTISVQTWRGENAEQIRDREKLHKFPTRGTHGGPLQHPDAEDRTDIP